MLLLQCFKLSLDAFLVHKIFEQCLYTFYLMSMIQKSWLQRQSRGKPKTGVMKMRIAAEDSM